MKRQPPLPLKYVVFLWGILCLAFLLWTTAPFELLKSWSMLLTFDEAWVHSNSFWPILVMTAMLIVGAIGVPIVCMKTYKGSSEAKNLFMILNFGHIASIAWGAFHITSFLFLAFALVPIGILVTMVSSEEIGNYFAVPNNQSESVK